MAWYYCDNGHPKPLLFTSPFGAPACSQCRQPTRPAHDVVRYTAHGDYTVSWHDAGHELSLRMNLGHYRVLIPDACVPTDTPAAQFSAALEIKPPTGTRWFGNVSSYPGGFSPLREAVPALIDRTKVLLGTNNQGASYGLAHVLKGHAQVFGTLVGFPPRQPATIPIDQFAANLAALTAAPGRGVGVRWVAKQTNNGRYVIHGVTANHQHGMLIVDSQSRLVTAYGGQNMSGLGQQPVTIKDWS